MLYFHHGVKLKGVLNSWSAIWQFKWSSGRNGGEKKLKGRKQSGNVKGKKTDLGKYIFEKEKCLLSFLLIQINGKII